MTHSHRLVHRLLWPVLALVVGFGFVMALYLRPLPSAPTTPATEEPRR